MTAQDVEDAIIQPMQRAFPPPTHVRGNAAAVEALLDVYRKALARFDRETLEQAWQKVAAAQTFWMWPMPEAIVKAADAIHNRTHPKPADPDAWVEKAQQLADAYVRRFMRTSRHAANAERGGYEAELKAYVQAVSWVQAQYIVERDGVGYDHHALFGDGPRDKKAEAKWFTRQMEQASSGAIKIAVPSELVEIWRQEAVGRGRTR